MQLSEFDYHLPEELIAKYPATARSSSRLLCVDRKREDFQHSQVNQLAELLNPNDLLIFNNSKVIPARLFGQKQSGGKIELLVERILNKTSVITHIKANRALREGAKLVFADAISAEVVTRHEGLYELRFHDTPCVLSYLQQHGEIPLPPYIDRHCETSDKARYQTIYAKHEGSAAAPTAGLHFDEELMQALKDKGIRQAFVTLHVGAGTFQPVRTENILQHTMHSEYLEVEQSVCQAVLDTRANGGRVVAVGTTSVRSLETAAKSGQLQPYAGETDIFIYPGYQFQCVDALLTNFHLPKSTLLMLVSAFSGQQKMRDAYQEAIAQQYRFFSYGDAMLLL